MPGKSAKIIIIAAPSGAGKTSVVRHLLKVMPGQLSFSISAATRKPRNNEKNGVDYYFISVEEFEAKIKADAFVEWEMVYEGKYYGTLVAEVERIWSEGKSPLPFYRTSFYSRTGKKAPLPGYRDRRVIKSPSQ